MNESVNFKFQTIKIAVEERQLNGDRIKRIKIELIKIIYNCIIID